MRGVGLVSPVYRVCTYMHEYTFDTICMYVSSVLHRFSSTAPEEL